MITNSIWTCLTFAATLAFAAPSVHHRQSEPTLKVTDFIAFLADPYVEGAQSNLSFHVMDARAGWQAEVDCVIPPTYFNIYAISALFDRCGDSALDFSYRYTETGLTVRRGWKANDTAYVQGSSTQATSWSSSTNITTLPDGKLYQRNSEWLFPLTVRASTPP